MYNYSINKMSKSVLTKETSLLCRFGDYELYALVKFGFLTKI